MRSVLIIDDDVRLSDMLRQYLELHEIAVTARHNGAEGLDETRNGRYDLVLLDVMLPDMDGFQVLSLLRASSDVCVMLLTAIGDAADRVRGLRMGADDSLAKPFDLEELAARIDAVLRRAVPKHQTASLSTSRLQRSELAVDPKSRTVRYGSEMLNLTDIEFSLMEIFVRSPGTVLTREELAEQVLQRPFHPLDRSLDMSVCRLRRKLRSHTPLADSIKTIRSSGYMFAVGDLHPLHNQKP
jgi:two-component system response regulator CpxR